MTSDLINALPVSLRGDLPLCKSRSESLCVLVVGVLVSRTISLSHLAGLFRTRAEIASNYRRLQRFFEQVTWEVGCLAQVRVRLSGLEQGPWLIALDPRAGNSDGVTSIPSSTGAPRLRDALSAYGYERTFSAGLLNVRCWL